MWVKVLKLPTVPVSMTQILQINTGKVALLHKLMKFMLNDNNINVSLNQPHHQEK